MTKERYLELNTKVSNARTQAELDALRAEVQREPQDDRRASLMETIAQRGDALLYL